MIEHPQAGENIDDISALEEARVIVFGAGVSTHKVRKMPGDDTGSSRRSQIKSE